MREVGGFVTDAQNRFCCSASNEAVGAIAAVREDHSMPKRAIASGPSPDLHGILATLNEAY